MTKTTKEISIGFDLDGIIIGTPPFIPKKSIEWLYRSHSGSKEIRYRIPGSFEKSIRWMSHHPLLRPPIKDNIQYIRSLSRKKNYTLIAISSRYEFLCKRTDEWFNYYHARDLFSKVYLNQKDEQAHQFKERIIKKLKLNYYVDDDAFLVKHLKKNIRDTRSIYIESGELLAKKLPKSL